MLFTFAHVDSVNASFHKWFENADVKKPASVSLTIVFHCLESFKHLCVGGWKRFVNADHLHVDREIIIYKSISLQMKMYMCGQGLRVSQKCPYCPLDGEISTVVLQNIS